MQHCDPHVGGGAVVFNRIYLVFCALFRLRNFDVVPWLDASSLCCHGVVASLILNGVDHKVFVDIMQVVTIGFGGPLKGLKDWHR